MRDRPGRAYNQGSDHKMECMTRLSLLSTSSPQLQCMARCTGSTAKVENISVTWLSILKIGNIYICSTTTSYPIAKRMPRGNSA